MVTPFAAVSRVEALAQSIRDTIAKDDMQAGDRVATVADLRAQTGLARQTITESLRLLADRGIIDIRPGRNGGAFVAAPNPVVRLRQTLLAVPNEAGTVADAVAVRDAMEELICLDAAAHLDASDAADLRTLMQEMSRSTHSWTAFMTVNWSLHERIADITPNEIARAVYLGTLTCIRDMSTEVRSVAEDPQAYWQTRLQVHVELVEAIISGDANRVRVAVREHSGLLFTRSAV